MATKNVVPRATGEGSVGTSSKKWYEGHFTDMYIYDDLTVTDDVDINGDIDVAGSATFSGSGKTVDLNGNELILDGDGDTTIHANTDDQIDFKVGGSDELVLTGSALYPATADGLDLGASGNEWQNLYFSGTLDMDGGEIILDANGNTTITADTDDQVDFKIGGTDQFSFKDGVIEPTTDNDVDLGSSSKEFKDLYVDGKAYIDELGQDLIIDNRALTDADGDTKIQLDEGNTNDDTFRVDTAGSEVMTIDSSGYVNFPKNAMFLVRPSSNQNNIAAGSAATIVFGTETFDIGSNFASNTFTAPVTGYYHFAASILLQAVDSAATSYEIAIVTDNDTYEWWIDPQQFAGDLNNLTASISVICNMSASHTAYMTFEQTGGSNQTDINTESWFSGRLVA
jgi:hypothetical protein